MQDHLLDLVIDEPFDVTAFETGKAWMRMLQASIVLPNGCIEYKQHKTAYFRGKNVIAWRFAWMLTKKRLIAPKMVVRHICKTKRCINPEHLQIGTQRENMLEDKIRDGTLPVGERNHNSKCTDQMAREIYASRGTGSRKERAEKFGVSVFCVKKIDCGATWSYATGNHRAKNKRRMVLRAQVDALPRTALQRQHYDAAIDRLQNKSYATDIGCIKSHFVKDRDGYGLIGLQKHQFKTHILSAIYFLNDCRPIADGLVVGHLCEQGRKNRDCHNPNHLRLMTHSENQSYRYKTITDEQIKALPNTHDFWRETANKKRKRDEATQELTCEHCQESFIGEKMLAAHIKQVHTQWP